MLPFQYLGLRGDLLAIKKPDSKRVVLWGAAVFTGVSAAVEIAGIVTVGATIFVGAATFVGAPLVLASHFVKLHSSFLMSLWMRHELYERLNTIVDYDRRRIVLFRT